jgi:VIT1/CCC1 family predicted Fe2+/Mn2+ transporter
MNLSFFRDSVFVRNLVFGIEDGLVSTVGLLSGIAIAGISGATIFLTGTILIFVEAFSMAAGSYLSEESVEENFEAPQTQTRSIEGSAVMFISYVVAGYIPLLPYVLMDVSRAFTTSIVLAFASLFILGLWSGRKSHMALKSAWRMAIVGGAAIIIGASVGKFFA